jgi:hypothetical protein
MRYSLREIRNDTVNPNKIIKCGVRLHCLKVLRYENFENSWVFPIAEILDGPHAGIQVDFSYISLVGKIDPKFLARQ